MPRHVARSHTCAGETAGEIAGAVARAWGEGRGATAWGEGRGFDIVSRTPSPVCGRPSRKRPVPVELQAGQVVRPETFQHGTSAQRRAWFQRGFDGGTIASCDSFADGAL